MMAPFLDSTGNEPRIIGFADEPKDGATEPATGGATATELAAVALDAQDRQDWTAALAAWTKARAANPGEATASIGAAQALRELGRRDEAAALLRAAAERFPDAAGVFHELGRLAERRGDWAEAAACWRRFVALDPGPWWGHVNLAHALCELGRFADAEAVAAAAQGLFPEEVEVVRAWARVALRRGAWLDAHRRFARVHEMSPDLAQDWAAVAYIRERLAEEPAGGNVAAVGSGAESELRDLLLRFESIGGNCEFGIVQRRFGAEYIGLLRWASIRPEPLAEILNRRFAGLGDPAKTHLESVRSFFRGEYEWDALADLSASKLRMHTFIAADEAQRETALQTFCRRMRFMRDGLIEALAAGEKIFVYKGNRISLTDGQIFALHAALRGYNPANRLLVVHLQDDKHRAGEVCRLADGLAVGFLEIDADGAPLSDIPYGTWIKIARRAAELLSRSSSMPSAGG